MKLLLAAFAVLALSCVVDAAGPPLTLYIGPQPTESGFVEMDKDTNDSIKDITFRLRTAKGIKVVTTPDKADVRLILLGRGIQGQSYGEQTRVTGTSLRSTPVFQSDYWVRTRLEVGAYTKEFIGTYSHTLAGSLGAWGECAKQIANDVKTWVAANAPKVNELRSQPTPAP